MSWVELGLLLTSDSNDLISAAAMLPARLKLAMSLDLSSPDRVRTSWFMSWDLNSFLDVTARCAIRYPSRQFGASIND